MSCDADDVISDLHDQLAGLEDDNAELTKRVTELEAKAAEVVAELRLLSDKCETFREETFVDVALNLVIEKFGVE